MGRSEARDSDNVWGLRADLYYLPPRPCQVHTPAISSTRIAEAGAFRLIIIVNGHLSFTPL
jgi:hypothetical protein